MTLNFFSGLINVFTAKNTKEKDFELWAKTEYRNDWQYAYEHMLRTGAGPRMYKEFEGTFYFTCIDRETRKVYKLSKEEMDEIKK